MGYSNFKANKDKLDNIFDAIDPLEAIISEMNDITPLTHSRDAEPKQDTSPVIDATFDRVLSTPSEAEDPPPTEKEELSLCVTIPTNITSTETEQIKTSEDSIVNALNSMLADAKDILDTVKYLIKSSSDPDPEAIKAYTDLIKTCGKIINDFTKLHMQAKKQVYDTEMKRIEYIRRKELEEIKGKRLPSLLAVSGNVNIDQSQNLNQNQNIQPTSTMFSQEDIVRMLNTKKNK